MELVYNIAEDKVDSAVVKVIGVGGGGCNAINNMINSGLRGVEFISANTDAQSLKNNLAGTQVRLGANLTKGLGAGADPEVGRQAALENRELIAEVIKGAHMLFITTGMGGGTGTGASPVIAGIAKEMGILTVAVVTRPFEYEGKRNQIAQEGIEALKEFVDSLIVIPNDNLLNVLGEDVSMREAFKAADSILTSAVLGIHEVVSSAGLINLDFSDVKNIMSIRGIAMMGSAEESGDDRARLATEKAISNPLLDNISLKGAKGVLLNITTAPGSLRMSEYREIMSIIDDYVDPSAERKYGTVEDENMDEDTIRVTIIATDLKDNSEVRQSSHLNIINNSEATGTEGIMGLGSIIRSGRNSGRSNRLTAEDFKKQSVMDNFEVPAMLRRQVD
ncbi:MAG: cell division protein FtsZ [Neisseriaceae bacterium]|nr:MAG: cell division protein FtsZ [Neisseriaceae bacterium]